MTLSDNPTLKEYMEYKNFVTLAVEKASSEHLFQKKMYFEKRVKWVDEIISSIKNYG